jgi:rhodanese-related sulfurtransferase
MKREDSHSAVHTSSSLQLKTASEVRASLLEGREIALLDVREEALHAEAHPLFAANLALSRLELDAYIRLPRKQVPIVLFDDGEGCAALAAHRLSALGYTDVSLLQGGLQGWRTAGFETFRDVNSPSKAFGELVEANRHTPSLSAQEVKTLIDEGADIFIVDARRYEEFQTMSIPTAISAPGGELVYRLQEIAERPATHIIVNCAGRTRSIIGSQSLINAGLPNTVTALRNGTIGWKLAHQVLDQGASREAPAPTPKLGIKAAAAARRVADSARVLRTSKDEIAAWIHANDRTTYFFDVRTPAEYEHAHISGFRSAPGGQLVQETDMFAPVRGARIVLADVDGCRANMTASWLSQMNWGVFVLDGLTISDFNVIGEHTPDEVMHSDAPFNSQMDIDTLSRWLFSNSQDRLAVLDFSSSREYRSGHIPGAWFALRSYLDEALDATRECELYVVTAREEAAAYFAWSDLTSSTSKPVYLLTGGTHAWVAAGHALQTLEQNFASRPLDYYRRPYEGTDASPDAMQAYLDWEFGLVDQLRRDGTHGFWVL